MRTVGPASMDRKVEVIVPAVNYLDSTLLAQAGNNFHPSRKTIGNVGRRLGRADGWSVMTAMDIIWQHYPRHRDFRFMGRGVARTPKPPRLNQDLWRRFLRTTLGVRVSFSGEPSGGVLTKPAAKATATISPSARLRSGLARQRRISAAISHCLAQLRRRRAPLIREEIPSPGTSPSPEAASPGTSIQHSISFHVGFSRRAEQMAGL